MAIISSPGPGSTGDSVILVGNAPAYEPLPATVNAGTIVTPPTGVMLRGRTAFASANALTVTTATFTPDPNTLLVALCSSGNGSGGTLSSGQVTDSLGATWTPLLGDSASSSSCAEVWIKDAGPFPAAQTVTWDVGGANASGNTIVVLWFDAAKNSLQNGQVATNLATGNFSTSLTPSVKGSVIVGAFGRASDATTPTALANTTLLGFSNGASGDTSAAFLSAKQITAINSTAFGFSNASTGVNRIALVEIVPGIPGGGAAALTATAPLSAASALSAGGTKNSCFGCGRELG